MTKPVVSYQKVYFSRLFSKNFDMHVMPVQKVKRCSMESGGEIAICRCWMCPGNVTCLPSLRKSLVKSWDFRLLLIPCDM